MANYNYDQDKKSPKDFKFIVFDALHEMEKSMVAGDIITFSNSLQALEILMHNKIDETYQDEYDKIEKKYKKQVESAGLDKSKKNVAIYNKLLNWGRLMMKMLQQSGYMPEEAGSYGRKKKQNI